MLFHFPNSQRTTVDKRKALHMCLILGAFGLHRFYLREYIFGFGYLVFFWTLVPLVLSLIDAAFLWNMSEDDFDEAYNQQKQMAA